MGSSSGKKQVTCFQCGKAGHYAKECRGASRGSGTGSTYGSNNSKTSTEETANGKAGNRVVECYGCGGEEHVRSECPTANKKTKSVKTRVAKSLAYNEVLAKVGGITMPVTLDSGVTISLLPEEANCVTRYTGKTVTLTLATEGPTSFEALILEAEVVIGNETITTTSNQLPDNRHYSLVILRINHSANTYSLSLGSISKFNMINPK